MNAESQLLTTFNTSWGQFCFTKMPFSLNQAPITIECNTSGVGVGGVLLQEVQPVTFISQASSSILWMSISKI